MEKLTAKKIGQTASLNNLLFYHSKFQEFLDNLASENVDDNILDVLIQIRQFNVDCIGRYSDLISRSDMVFKPDMQVQFKRMGNNGQSDLAMTELNTNLSLLIPAYVRALSNKSLNPFARMIIGNNYEKILSIKDNLLHPLPEFEFV
jgi:hypothetical protein